MLRLVDIVKEYPTGDEKVTALKGVSIEFRNNEFVSILGHSGCGKTTLLNIIGGLDQYTTGDLIIEGKSTKDFTDSDWDTYRNHSIGFVFQSYNLIPHQTVLANVELALTLSGVNKADRKKRATEALEKVGLGDQLNKKPNQLSGGQMQRVAIARALVNDPEILLADEPTGALDSDTSVQIMEILKEISNEKLIIMVTHNPELAEQYSTRIVKLLDGKIVDDSAPYSEEAEEQTDGNTEKSEKEPPKKSKKEKDKYSKKTSMSFATALSLSLNNLLTKKMRTFLTSFAGSIGIIGIALIMSLQNGVQLYIQSIQREALAGYPLTIESQAMDMSSMASMLTGSSDGEYVVNHELDKVYSNTAASAMIQAMTAGVHTNDLTALKKYFDEHEDELKDYVSDIKYTYSAPMNIYAVNTGTPVKVNPSPMLDMVSSYLNTGDSMLSSVSSSISADTISSYYNMWTELLDNEELLDSQYDIVKGRMPENYNEVVLVVDKNNEVSELALQALGLADPYEMVNVYMAMMNGEEYTPENKSYTYDEILGLSFKLVLSPSTYEKNSDGTWTYVGDDEEKFNKIVEESEDIKIVGIIRPSEGSIATMTGGNIGYTHELTDYVLQKTSEYEIVKAQLDDPDTDVFTGIPFEKTEEETAEETKAKTEDTDVFVKPTVAPIGLSESTPEATFTSMTEEEIIAEIKENTTGDEQALYLEMVEIMMKDSPTLSECNTLAEDIKKATENMSEEELDSVANGFDISKVNGSMLRAALMSMTKEQKLEMLEGMVTSSFGDTEVVPAAETTESDKKSDSKTSDSKKADDKEDTKSADEEDTETEGAETEDAETQNAEVEEVAEQEEEKPTTYALDYEDALDKLGYSCSETPLSINIYPKDFESKDYVTDFIQKYNDAQKSDDDKVIYTDYIGMILSSVTTIIDTVSYVLIAFVAISLIVSSIMIGIITYISVLERTKEIGILRAIGASKRDISRVFNAETLIVGFVSGALGIGVTLLLCIPINLLLHHFTTINAAAQLPVAGGIGLVIISMLLTFVAGLIPSGIASRKDPVVALRTE